MTVETIQCLKADDSMILKKETADGPIYTPSVMLAFGEKAEDWTEITMEQYGEETKGGGAE